MKFDLTSEQRQFRDSIARLVDAQKPTSDGMTADRYAAAWHAFAELGMTGLCLGEAQGGFSGAAEDIALVAMELGRAPVSTPRMEVAAAAAALLAARDGSTAATLREGFVAGTLQPAVAIDTAPAGIQHSVTAARRGSGYVLDGQAAAVIGGATADYALIAAMLTGRSAAVFAVPLDAAGVERTPYRLADTTPVADLCFAGVEVDGGALMIDGLAARAALDAAADVAVMTQCAVAVGSIDRSIAMTIDYLKTRHQFGRPLAEFQALQHRIADLFIAASDARSILYAAVAGLSAAPDERRRVVSACKVKVARAAKDVIGAALHLHGGIGVTTEYAIGHHFRRALVDEKLFGDIEHHLARHLAARPPCPTARTARAAIDLATVTAFG